MNSITVKKVKTCYDYSTHYWLVDGKPVDYYLDEGIQNNPALSNMSSMLGLLPAWGGELEWQWENDFIWEMVDSSEELNVPILVCPDDCDLSCTVIVAHIRKDNDKVFWERMGLVHYSNWNYREEQQSGILYLEAYTDEDWELYGDNIATEKFDSHEYWEWVDENCYEECIRRLRNYTKPYMQRDENIEWLLEVNWEFDAKEYMAVVEKFRELKDSHTN